MKLIFYTFIILFYNFQLQGQDLPHRYGNAKVFYADLMVFEALNPDTAYADMLEYVNENIVKKTFKDLRTDSNRLEIKFKYVSTAYSKFPNQFGHTECEVSVRYFPNRIGYSVTDFKHFLNRNSIPCFTEIEKDALECYESHLAATYWKNIKKGIGKSMNDFIMMIYFSSLKRQPTSKALKLDDYFLIK